MKHLCESIKETRSRLLNISQNIKSCVGSLGRLHPRHVTARKECKLRIYISGGITDVPDYKDNFDRAEERLKREHPNVEIINPTMLVLPNSCTHDDYMKIDLMLLDLADAIYMLKGWEKSLGANREYGYALAKNKMILMEK